MAVNNPKLEYTVATKTNTKKKVAPTTAKPAPAKKSASKADKPAELKRHPLSDKYGPKMVDEELQGLATDIKAHGQHEPIIMYEGMVLAGWNRYQSCLLAKVEPKLRDMDPTSNPVAVAFGTNFMRRKLSSVQKAFYGAQFCLDANLKQTDVAKQMACNLNRLNQCCQLLKLDTPAAKKVIEQLRDNPELSSAQFDESMLELGIAREPKPTPPRPARASASDDPLEGMDDDPDVDDLTGGAIDDLLGGDDIGDEESPEPATRRGKGSKPGDPIGDDAPLPSVGAKRSKMTNPHETPVSRIASAFKHLSAAEQRQFVKFAWGKLKAALDESFSHGDVEYTMPALKVDPSLIARSKPTGKLDDGAPSKKGGKPTPAKKSTPGKPEKPKAPAPKGKSKGGKHASASAGKPEHDEDI